MTNFCVSFACERCQLTTDRPHPVLHTQLHLVGTSVIKAMHLTLHEVEALKQEVLLATALEHVPTSLYGHKLIDSHCVHLASGIRNNKTLERLDLSNKNLRGPDFRDLMKDLATRQIKELILTCNNLTDSSCTHLALEIRRNRNLKKLDLSNNNLEGPHFRDLLTALSTSWIEELLLRDVKLTDEYAPFLVSLSNCPALTVLDLRYNNLTDASTGYIQDLILTSTSLKEVRTDGNDRSFDEDGILRKIMNEIQDFTLWKQSKSGYGDHEGGLVKSPSAESEEEPDNLVTPIVDGNTYRLQLKPDRLFCCSETGIKFKVKSEAIVTYELGFDSDNVNKIQKDGYDVVGPMFNITVEPKVVSEVYLPHYLHLQGLKREISLIRCGNFKDGKFNIIKPVTIGPSHIVLQNPSFSLLVPLFLKLWKKPIPFEGKALLYSKVVCPEDVNCLEYKFHLYVVPRNQPEITKLNVRKQTHGFQGMEKPHTMRNRLYTKTDYTVKVHPDGKISPKLLRLKMNYETEDLPFIEVIVDRNVKELVLSLKDSELSLWEGEVTEGELREMQLRARESVTCVGSSSTTEHFVDKHYEQLVQKVANVKEVLDKLKNLLTDEQCDIVRCEKISQDQMRELFRIVRGWGDDGKNKLLDVLEKTNKELINRLRRQ